jgi:NAD(P)-dependent dehydrogenase (short-subunit alcohol dehydrogenase family)
LTLPERHIGLLTDDGSLATTKLAQFLTQQGWKVVVLSFPPSLRVDRSPLPEGVPRAELEDLSEECLQRKLAAISTTYGPIGAFVHLHPLLPVSQNDGLRYLDIDKAIVKHVFLMAKHLKLSLNQAASQGCGCFVTAARLDGAFGLAGEVNFSAIGAGLFGLTKSLNQEWKPVICRAIDLNPALDVEESARAIIAELHDPDRSLAEVGYGVRGRTTLALA